MSYVPWLYIHYVIRLRQEIVNLYKNQTWQIYKYIEERRIEKATYRYLK